MRPGPGPSTTIDAWNASSHSCTNGSSLLPIWPTGSRAPWLSASPLSRPCDWPRTISKTQPILNRDFEEFAELPGAEGVDYLVVGDYALAAHGHPRYTGDIDFWIRPLPENIDRLLGALQDFGFGSLGLQVMDFGSDTVVQLGQPPRRIDLLTAIDGVDFEACFARREQVEFGTVWLNVIGLDDFTSNKRASGRLKDLADLELWIRPPED